MTTKHGVPIPDDHVIVIFGATGDLAKRKLLPGLFHLANAGLLPKKYRIIGSSKSMKAPGVVGITSAQGTTQGSDVGK